MRVLSLLAVLAAMAPAAAQSVPSWAAPSDAPPVSATVPGPDDGPGTPGDPGPAEVPLDGGLGLLALAGGAYAARRLRRR